MTGDPDLDQTCEDMASQAKRFRLLQSMAVDPKQPYSTLLSRKMELADAEEEFANRGERLRMHPDRRLAGRALLLVVEEVSRLRIRLRRRPNAVQLYEAIKVAVDAAERDRVEAEANFSLAMLSKAQATFKAASGSAAMEYLEACR